jgi:hypothetical protein
MGRGTYIPRSPSWVDEDIRYCYVGTVFWADEDDDERSLSEQYEDSFYDFVDELRYWADDHGLIQEEHHDTGGMLVIASYIGPDLGNVYCNLDLAITEWETDIVVALAPISWEYDDDPEVLEAVYDQEADKGEELFRKLVDDLKRWGFRPRYRTGPHTSAYY